MTGARKLLLIGPPGDSVLDYFHQFCGHSDVISYRISRAEQILFSVSVGRTGDTEASVILDNGYHSLSDVALFVRQIGPFVHASLNDEFSKGEYFSAIWALSAVAPAIINRPGRWAWQFQEPLERFIGEEFLLPRSTSNSVGYFFSRREGLPSVYGRSEVMGDTELRPFSFGNECCLEGNLDDSYHGRFVADTSHIVQMFYGSSSQVLLNDSGVDISVPSYQSLMIKIQEFAELNDLHHFAIVVKVVDQEFRLAKLELDPPFSWFADKSDSVFSDLVHYLCHEAWPD